MNSITLAKDFDVSKLSYNDVRVLDNGGKVVYVSYNKAPLILQTPEMIAPFGLQKWTTDNRDKYTLDLSFRNMDNRPALQAFFNVLEGLDKKLVEDGFKNQQTWFKGRKYNSVEVLEALYTPLIRYAKDKNTGEVTDKYPPSFKMTVPSKEDKFLCEVYDDKRTLVDLNSLNTKGARVAAIIQFMGLWFAGGKFGSSWRVVQMKVTPNQNIRGFSFKEDPDDKIEEDLEEAGEPHDAKEILEMAAGKSEDESPNGDDVEVSDSDEDELERPASARKTAPKKVVVKRKP
jgi:hypothetical protein